MALKYDPQVAAQQAALNQKGANLKVDGLLGPLTQAAITKYATPTPVATPKPIIGQSVAGTPIYGGAGTLSDPSLNLTSNISTSPVNNQMAAIPVPTTSATNTPVVPTAPTTSTDIESYKAQVAAAQNLSTDEINAQKAIDTNAAAERQGEFNVGQQPVAQGFISGQQSAIQTQNDLTKIPLQQQLALAQAKRQASLDAAKTSLEQANADRAYNAGQTKATADEKYRQDVLAETKRNNTLDSQKSNSANALLTQGQMQSALTNIASQFDNEPAVRSYQTIAQTLDAIKGLGISPTDDIRRVYAVAKVFDPNSAVREGEYKTVQDYATSLFQRAGLKANRVFNNDGFLTEEARNFINTTLDNELKTANKSYQNIYQGYQKKIDDVKTGKASAGLVDYSAAFNGSQNSPSNSSSVSFNDPKWLSDYNYDRDIKFAQDAIKRGADKAAIQQVLQKKYKTVNL